MGEITIKCCLDSQLTCMNYEIRVYDFDKKLVCNEITDKFGIFKFTPKKYGVYQIVVQVKNSCSCFNKISTSCYFTGKNIEIPFVFSNKKSVINHPVTLKLTDKYYENLPIMKEEIILCNTMFL